MAGSLRGFADEERERAWLRTPPSTISQRVETRREPAHVRPRANDESAKSGLVCIAPGKAALTARLLGAATVIDPFALHLPVQLDRAAPPPGATRRFVLPLQLVSFGPLPAQALAQLESGAAPRARTTARADRRRARRHPRRTLSTRDAPGVSSARRPG
jgi:hypothetical protein